MSKPVIFVDMVNATYAIDKTVRISDITNPKRPHMLDIEIFHGDDGDCGSIRTVRDANRRSGLFIVDMVEQPKTWFAPAHCMIFHALEKLFEGYMTIEYVTNVVGVYRFHVVVGDKNMLDSEQFQTPSTEGFESTLTGIEPADQVRDDRRTLRAEHIREEFNKLSSQIDTLDSVKERLPAVYDTDFRSGIAIAYHYNGLYFYINQVDGEIDQAAVLCTHQGEAVGIFFYENVFVAKRQLSKRSPIDLSVLDAADFSVMLENYSDVADVTGLIAPHRRSGRNRNGRERDSRRGSRDDSPRDHNRRDGNYRGS